MGHTSVKAAKLRPDLDLPSQDAREHAALRRELEAREAAAGVGAAARLGSAGHEHAVADRETEQLALRRPPAAASACSFRGPRKVRSTFWG
jgi:hypothetical protein